MCRESWNTCQERDGQWDVMHLYSSIDHLIVIALNWIEWLIIMQTVDSTIRYNTVTLITITIYNERYLSINVLFVISLYILRCFFFPKERINVHWLLEEVRNTLRRRWEREEEGNITVCLSIQGLTHYDYVLHARTTGFVHIVQRMRKRGYIKWLYDVTIGEIFNHILLYKWWFRVWWCDRSIWSRSNHSWTMSEGYSISGTHFIWYYTEGLYLRFQYYQNRSRRTSSIANSIFLYTFRKSIFSYFIELNAILRDVEYDYMW